jgi:serine/threonine protein kinase
MKVVRVKMSIHLTKLCTNYNEHIPDNSIVTNNLNRHRHRHSLSNHQYSETEMTTNIISTKRFKPINPNTIYVGRGTKWYDDFAMTLNINSLSKKISRYLKTTINDIVDEYDKYIDGIVKCNILKTELVCDCQSSPDHQCHKFILYELIDEINKIPGIDKGVYESMTSIDRHAYIHDRIYLGKNVDDPFFAVGHILENRFKITRLLVDGSFGCVFYGIDLDKNSANKQVIIKISKSDNGSIKILRSEYQYLMRLSVRKIDQDIVHDNDVIFPHVIDSFKIPSHTWSSHEFYQAMVLERYGEDLYSYMTENSPSSIIYSNRYNGMTLKNIQLVVRQLAKTVKVLHDMNIIHKDIKCENILLRKSIISKKGPDPDPFDIVLIDYGFAINMEKTIDAMYHHTSGTIAYMSPEEIFGTGYNKSVDIFNIGMVIVELSRGMYVFENNAWFIANVYRKIYPESPHTYNKLLMNDRTIDHDNNINVEKDHIGIPYNMNYFVHGISDPDLANLIKGCVTFDMNQRISINCILNHPFLMKTIKEHGSMAFNMTH